MQKKPLQFRLIIIIFILVAGGVGYAWMNRLVDQKDSIRQLNVDSSKKRIDASGWKTYRNEMYRYEIMYPVSWSYKDWLESQPGKLIVFSPGSKVSRTLISKDELDNPIYAPIIHVGVTDNFKGLSGDDWLNAQIAKEARRSLSEGRLTLDSREPVFTDSLKGIKAKYIVKYLDGQNPPFFEAYFFVDNKIFLVQADEKVALNKAFLEIYNRMITSFRILNRP